MFLISVVNPKAAEDYTQTFTSTEVKARRKGVKMSILTVFELPTMDVKKYNQTIKGLEAAGQGNPDGRLYHVASLQKDGSILVTDVWESAELLDKFGKTLVPVLKKAGVEPVQPIAMSRTQLHRKLKALTGKSASTYIRSVKLSKAKKMIEEQKGNISEIAYSVGFASPAYFTKCFKEEFGYPPSSII